MSASKNEFQAARLPDIALADMFRQHLVIVEGESIQPNNKLQVAPQLPEKLVPAPPKQMPPPPPEPVSHPQVQPALAGPPYPILGKFSRQVLVILQDPSTVHCNDDDLSFLTKVISAVGLSMEHIAILNAYGKQLTYPDLKAQLPAKTAIYFGVEPVSIGVPMRFPHFQVQPWDGCTFLYAPSLAELNGASPQQVELKKQLWIALKKIFG